MEGAPRYEIVDTIATGDFAVVYRARDRGLGREVAIKQIHQQYLTDERQLARYWQEARVLASLQHPNILTIYDIVRPKGWLIVELMRGQSAAGHARRGHRPGFSADRADGLPERLAIPALQGRDPRRHQAEQHPGRCAGPGEAGRFRARPPRQQRGRQPAEGHDQVHGAGAALGPVRPGGAGQRPVFAGFLGLRVDVRGAVRDALSRPGQLRPRQADRLDDVARGRRSQHAADQPRAGRRARRPGAGHPAPGHQGPVAAVTSRPRRRCGTCRSVRWRPGCRCPDEPDAAAEAAKAAAAKRKRRMRYAAMAAAACSLVLCVAMFSGPASPPPNAGPAAADSRRRHQRYPKERRQTWPSRWPTTASRRSSSSTADARIFINDEPRLLRDLQPHDQVVVTEVIDSGRKIKEVARLSPRNGQRGKSRRSSPTRADSPSPPIWATERPRIS